MKFEGDLTSIMVTRDFLWQQLPLFLPLLGKKMAVVWMAVMMRVAEAKGWCWWDLWTPWPLSPGNLQEAKAYLQALGLQRSLSTMSALCHTKCQRVLQRSRLELLPERKLLWSRYSDMPAALLYCNDGAKAIQDVLEEIGCSVGEYNINALELLLRAYAS